MDQEVREPWYAKTLPFEFEQRALHYLTDTASWRKWAARSPTKVPRVDPAAAARAATLALGPDARRGRTKYALSAHCGTTLMWDRVRAAASAATRGTFVGDRAAHLRHAAVSVK